MIWVNISPLEQNKDMHLFQSNRDGKRSEKVKMVLDLSKSKEIRLHPDHNCQVRRIYVSNLTTTTEGISPTKVAPRVRQEWRFWAISGLHFQSPYITNSQPNLNPSILKILTHPYKGGLQTSRPRQRNSWRVWPGSVRVGDHRESITVTVFTDRPHTRKRPPSQAGLAAIKSILIDLLIITVIFQIEGVTLLLGGWWLEAARRGGPDTLPVINCNPEVDLFNYSETITNLLTTL